MKKKLLLLGLMLCGLGQDALANSWIHPGASSGGGGSPPATIADAIPSGLTAFWDGKVYSGSGAWLNQIASPADGSAQSAYNATPTSTAMYQGSTKWVCDNTNTMVLASNPTLIANMHKTSVGNAWTWFARIRTNTTQPGADSLFGTGDTAGNHGIGVRIDAATGDWKLDQWEGTTRITKTSPADTVANTMHNLVVSYSQTTGLVYFANNQDTFATQSAGWTADTSAATYPARILSEGNAGNVCEAGVEVYGMGLVNKVISGAELIALNDYLEARYPAPAATVPPAPDAFFGNGLAGVAYLSHYGKQSPGASNTDYIYEYKLSSSGSWTVYSDGVDTDTKVAIPGLTNNVSYDFRVKAVNSVGQSAYSDVWTMTLEASYSDPYDVTLFKVTLPENNVGTRVKNGSVVEIEPPAISTYVDSYFGRGSGKVVFICPPGGATTATATYGRTEMRHLTNQSIFVSSSDTLKFSVDHIPLGGKTVVHQIHDLDAPWIKVQYEGSTQGAKKIRALYKQTGVSDSEVWCLNDGSDCRVRDIFNNLTDGDIITSTIDFVVTSQVGTLMTGYLRLTVSANGTTNVWKTQAFSRDSTAAGGATMYYKRGNYFQSIANDNTYSKVTHYTQSGTYTP